MREFSESSLIKTRLASGESGIFIRSDGTLTIGHEGDAWTVKLDRDEILAVSHALLAVFDELDAEAEKAAKEADEMLEAVIEKARGNHSEH
jgi:hypothetical protein